MSSDPLKRINELSWTTILFATLLVGLPFHSAAETIPFDSERWQITARESAFTTHLGRECLELYGGVASLNDVVFTDGVIEFDIAFNADRGFAGVMFRMQDANNFEHFYLRPHQSGMPDANQYNPVFHGVAGWQLYHGPQYGTAVVYPYDQWIPVKLVVRGTEADVYIQDMETPVLFIQELKRGIEAGAVAVNAAPFAPAWFSNFRIDAEARPPLVGRPTPIEEAPANRAASWFISTSFDEKLLEDVSHLDAARYRALEWTPLECEPPGLANIARVSAFSDTTNAVFARLVVVSGREQGKLFRFGYSDRARVFFNNQLIYAGNNGYQSRDYRFLGTIGLFDGVYLPLQKGRNEIWFAVSEDFGGWGVMGEFTNMDGITFGSPE